MKFIPICVVCRLDDGATKNAVTAIKGYWVCDEHLSWDCDFFQRWEKIHDPHHPTGQLGGQPYVAA